MSAESRAARNPPIEYAVAAWIGMPDEEIARGLREGWIRGPQQAGMVSPSDATTVPSPPDVASADAIAPPEQRPRTDRGRIEVLMRTLDRTLDESTFAAVWNESGSTDEARATRLTAFLSRILGAARHGDGQPAWPQLEEAAQQASGEARLVRLGGRTGSELEAMARQDAGVRMALATGERWAFAGDRTLASRSDPTGRFDRFDRDNGEALLSDAWIGDRARRAAWRHAGESGHPLAVQGAGWRFVDRADPSATLELEGSDGGEPYQVVFARDGGDRVSGAAGTDRLHGGDGADVLIGRGGDDLVHGGRGDDMLLGGAGRDELAGQQGDDELDGGSGDDRLDGGGGRDTLTGGRGDDLLRGGTGLDVYGFEAGDGRDTVEDDGGEIVLDETALSGTMRRDGGGWTSADGRYRFTLDGTLGEGGTLTIARGDADADRVTIAQWRQGAFGFSLAGDDGGQVIDAPAAPPPGERDARHTGEEGAIAQLDASPWDVLGNEGSPGIVSMTSPAGEVVVPDLAGLAPDPLVDATLVDAVSVALALGEWSIPAPPDPGGPSDLEAAVVSEGMIADALAADGSLAEDGDAGGGLVAVDSLGWSRLTGPDASHVPPPLAVLRTHA